MTKPIVQILKGEKVSQTPFWLMRQAGRYLPEYRELRASKGGFLDMAFDPKAACEITMQPLRRFGMSGAILFSDILTVPYGLGQHLEFVPGVGPRLDKIDDVDGLSFDDFDQKMQPVYDAVSLIKAQLAQENFDQTALIGFAGAPWTVATYMVEGAGSKDYMNIKALAYGDPERFSRIIDLLVDATSRYLIAQIKAGAEVVKIFDSWAGVLGEDEFYRWCILPVRQIVQKIRAVYPDTPIIGFPRGAGLYYPAYVKETGVDGCAVDSMVPLDFVEKEIQSLVPVQGTLDPAFLMAGGRALENKLHQILEMLGGQRFIFNLGHGIHKETPIENVEMLSRIVKEYRLD